MGIVYVFGMVVASFVMWALCRISAQSDRDMKQP